MFWEWYTVKLWREQPDVMSDTHMAPGGSRCLLRRKLLYLLLNGSCGGQNYLMVDEKAQLQSESEVESRWKLGVFTGIRQLN